MQKIKGIFVLTLFSDPNVWLALVTLTLLEIVLGIDNIIFLSITVLKLPKEQQKSARLIGLLGAMLMRLGLLASVNWLSHLQNTLFILPILEIPISARDLILFFGGLFLVYKGLIETINLFKDEEEIEHQQKITFFSAITQIMILDIVFSLDSVITAVGLSGNLIIMAIAIIIAIFIMIFCVKSIGSFVERYILVKILAFTFLALVGVFLMLDGLHIHLSKEYLYFAVFFSLIVVLIDIFLQKKKKKSAIK